jgi:hypothetical protein
LAELGIGFGRIMWGAEVILGEKEEKKKRIGVRVRGGKMGTVRP